jgi:hypothetical protein
LALSQVRNWDVRTVSALSRCTPLADAILSISSAIACPEARLLHTAALNGVSARKRSASMSIKTPPLRVCRKSTPGFSVTDSTVTTLLK